MQKEVKDKIVSLHSQTRVQTSIKNEAGWVEGDVCSCEQQSL